MARIGNNIYFRQSTGKWEGRFIRGRQANGRLSYGYVSGETEMECTIKRDLAAKAYEETRRQAQMGSKIIFSAIAAQWLDSESRTKKDSTICKYRNNLTLHLIPRFGCRILAEIRREEVMDYIAELRTKGKHNGDMMSPNTVKGIVSVLRGVMAYGESQYHLPTADLGRLFIGTAQDISLRLLTEHEEAVLLEYILSNLDNEKMGILLVLYTGLRLGELCALRWGDIDFRERTLAVHATMKRIQTPYGADHRSEVVVTLPKSRKSIRTIPLHEDILELLKKRAGKNGTFFLTGKENIYVEPRTMQNRFKVIIKDAGIAEANFHALRHTFATRSIESGIDAKILSEILGHASVRITLDRYVHPSEEQKRKSMNSLPGFRSKIGRKCSETQGMQGQI